MSSEPFTGGSNPDTDPREFADVNYRRQQPDEH